MNISALNAARLVPTMSEIPGSIDNELLPGLLQLTKHTHFILDEIGMDTGTLNDTGTVLFRRVWSLFGPTRKSSPVGQFFPRWIKSINQV